MKSAIPLFLCLLAGNALAQDKPILPFYDWDACPFECCTYGQWTVNRPLSLHQTHAKESPVLFRLNKGQNVQGVTGVVITTKCGVTTALETFEGCCIAKDGTSPLLKLEKGEKLCTLNYEGEGSSLVWYRGKLYSAGVPLLGDPNAESDQWKLRTESEPESTWWVMVRTSSDCDGVSCRPGQVGWTSETEAFDHKDSCE